jgi:ubiquinone/menaquinone biosynthesis C-methylase UbiE
MDLRVNDVPAVAAALGAALTTGLLKAMGESPGSPAELARRCDLDPRACAHVLDVLSACGLATRDGDRYTPAPELVEYGARSRPLAQFELDLFHHAPTFLRTGQPLLVMDAGPSDREALYRDVVPELGELFARAAEQLAERCGLAPRTILDVGCGSGVWSLAFARRSPEARVTGLDLPAVVEQFRARAARMGLFDRTATIEGDMHTVPIPAAQFDLAIIANVLRLEQPDAARALMKRLGPAVRSGGSILVVDALAGGTPASERARAIYGFHLALRTTSGRVHRPAEIGEWLTGAGFEAPAAVVLDDRWRETGALGALLARKR